MSTFAPPPTSTFDMHAGGALSLSAGDTVEVALFSNTDSSYRAQNVYFSAAQISAGPSALGFSVDFTADKSLTAVRSRTTLTDWQTLSGVSSSHGLFTTASDFNMQTGVYTVPKTGLYLVQAQVCPPCRSMPLQKALNGLVETVDHVRSTPVGWHQIRFTGNHENAS